MKIGMRFPWYLFNSCEIFSGSKSVRMVFSKYGIIGRASYHILPLFLLKYENLLRYMSYVIIKWLFKLKHDIHKRVIVLVQPFYTWLKNINIWLLDKIITMFDAFGVQ